MKPTRYTTSDRGELVDLGAVFDNELAPPLHSFKAPWAKQSAPSNSSAHDGALIDGWLKVMLGDIYSPQWKP
jgi:hypothetical protein